MRLSIKGKVYPSLELESVSLLDILRFEGEVQDLRVDAGWTWPQVLGTSQEFDGLSSAELGAHPKWPWFLASIIWAARRNAGEEVTFIEAISNYTQNDIDFIEEPGDRKPGKQKGPKKARKVSAPVVSPAGDGGTSTPTTPQESESPSESESSA